MFAGVGLTVHLLFVAVTVFLLVAGYNILPLVFDDIPLTIQNDVMYRRELVRLT